MISNVLLHLLVFQKIHHPAPKPSSVTVDKTTNSIGVGDKVTIVASVIPVEASQEVNFTSSDVTKVSVKNTGEYTGVAVGNAVITVASVEDSLIKKEVVVTVTEAIPEA